MRRLFGCLLLGCAVLAVVGLAGSMGLAYLRNTRSNDADANAQVVVNEVRPYVLGTSAPPWLARYQEFAGFVGAQDGGLTYESPCPSLANGRCRQKLVATTTSLRLELPMPASNPNGPQSPLVIFRDSNLDGWPDAFAMTDDGSPWGECFDPAASLSDGFCLLPPRGAIRDENDPMFGVVAMWMIKIQGALLHQLPP